MKTKFLAILLGLGLSLHGFASDVAQSLAVRVPAGWKLEFQGDKGLEFYSAIQGAGKPSLLMFSRWPVPGSKAQIPLLLDSMAKMFVSRARTARHLQTKEYKIEKIKGGSYPGMFVMFEMKSGALLSLFMISNGNEIWVGQFCGSKEHWNEALSILRKLRKK